MAHCFTLTQVKQASKRDYQQHHHYQHFSSSFSSTDVELSISLTSIHTHTNTHFLFIIPSPTKPNRTEPIRSYPILPLLLPLSLEEVFPLKTAPSTNKLANTSQVEWLSWTRLFSAVWWVRVKSKQTPRRSKEDQWWCLLLLLLL